MQVGQVNRTNLNYKQPDEQQGFARGSQQFSINELESAIVDARKSGAAGVGIVSNNEQQPGIIGFIVTQITSAFRKNNGDSQKIFLRGHWPFRSPSEDGINIIPVNNEGVCDGYRLVRPVKTDELPLEDIRLTNTYA